MRGKKGGKVETKNQHVVITSRLMCKYGGIKWNDPDNENRILCPIQRKCI